MLCLNPSSFPATPYFRTNYALLIIVLIFLNFTTITNAVEIFNYTQCSIAANATYNAAPNDTFLRDQNGNPTSNFSEAWGISYYSCKVLCAGGSKFIDWNVFSLQFGSWLLPWLALTAQLPFETKSKSTNLQSLFLAIGSPILIIYSLALTILNARSINREFRQLKEENEELERPRQTKVIGAGRVILIESQSIPLQIINGADRELAQLIVNPENWTWWIAVKNEILKTKREWTYSLIAQLIMVVTAQVLSIIDFFTSPADETTVSVGLGINSLWIWMIPVTFGWVKVGTQTSAGSIKAALKSVPVPRLGGDTNVTGRCIGIRDRTQYGTSYQSWTAPPVSFGTSGLHRRRHTEDDSSSTAMSNLEHLESQQVAFLNQTSGADIREYPTPPLSNTDQHSQTGPVSENARGDISGDSDRNTNREIETPELHLDDQPERTVRETFIGFSVTGDDSEPGPIFNYARVWSRMNAVARIVEALSSFTDKQKRRPRQRVDREGPWDDSSWDVNLEGTPEQMSRYISARGLDVQFLPVHSQPLSGVAMNCCKASIAAIFLGWGTTGAGLLIAYKTPTVGLGCDSGAYLIYGVCATISWILLTTSAYLSHIYCKRNESTSPHLPNSPILGPAAVILRLSGKAIALTNACFFVITSMLQFTNLYNNCWCSAAVMGLGAKKAWVVLFASDAQIAAFSKNSWIAGVAMSIVVGAITLYFILGSRGDEIFNENSQ